MDPGRPSRIKERSRLQTLDSRGQSSRHRTANLGRANQLPGSSPGPARPAKSARRSAQRNLEQVEKHAETQTHASVLGRSSHGTSVRGAI